MTGIRSMSRGAAVLGVAGLAAVTSLTAGPAAGARPARPGPPIHLPAGRVAHASAPWRSRTVLRESARVRFATQVVSPARSADFALVPVNRPETRFQLRRISLASGAVQSGPRFSVSGMRLASGFLWVYGPVYSGPHGTRVRLVLHQVSPSSLRLIRSWTLLPTRRLVSLADVSVTAGPGPGRTVWVGFRRTLRLISASTGAVRRRARVPAGFSITDVAADEIGHRLYVAAAPRQGGGAVFEYQSINGLLLASATGKPVGFAVAGAALTAVPGGVWASFRTGMLGETVLLRRRELTAVPLHRPIFGWAMFASTVFGGSLWLARQDGVIGCIGPQTGRVRSRATLPALRDSGQLLTVDPGRHLVYGVGRDGVVAITAPAPCWG
ncbi:MAG TPA: hypothetical protein VF204_24855 [Streptosporangiaceae bacterium]